LKKLSDLCGKELRAIEAFIEGSDAGLSPSDGLTVGPSTAMSSKLPATPLCLNSKAELGIYGEQ
jgi:hypothetical protein